jgi:Sugar-transfer associated ATP-grasp
LSDGLKKPKNLSYEPCQNLWESLLEAERQSGRSLPSLLAEIVGLRLRGLRASEYFIFQLYLPVPGYGKSDFAGNRTAITLNQRFNPHRDWILVDDKLVCQTFLDSLGISTPTLVAAYYPGGRETALAPVLTEPEQLKSFLKVAPFPLFVKPICDGGGNGCFRAEGWSDGELALFGGRLMKFSELLKRAHKPGRFGGPGLLFQKPVIPHQELKQMHRFPSSVRVAVLLTRRGPKPIRAAMRIPTGNNVVDNFHDGSYGNLVSQVDMKNGTVGEAVAGLCARQHRLTHHPNSNAPIRGRSVPHWDRLLELVCRGSMLFPTLRFQHWDLVVTEEGPTVLEVNVRGGLQILQHAGRLPFLEPRIRQLLDSEA